MSPQHHLNTHRVLTVCQGLEHLLPLLIPEIPCLVDRPQAIHFQRTKEETEAWNREAEPGATGNLRTRNDRMPHLRTHASFEGSLLFPSTPYSRTCPDKLLSTSVLIMPPGHCPVSSSLPPSTRSHPFSLETGPQVSSSQTLGNRTFGSHW